MIEKPAEAHGSQHRFVSFDKTPIFYQLVEAKQKTRVVLLIQHGMGEHGSRYLALAESLSQRGIACCIPDLRGFGLSGGKRGCLCRFSDYFRDLEVLSRLLRQGRTKLPFFVLGHSFGGLIVSAWIAESSEIDYRGLLLTSPNFGISIPIAPWRRWLAMPLSYLIPDFTQNNQVDPRWLTHDLSVTQSLARDPLVHKRISVGLYRELSRQLSRVDEIASKIHCPTLVLQAGDDHVVSKDDTIRFYEHLNVRDKKLKIYEGLYHEILNEAERPAIFSLLGEWVEERLI